MTPSRIHVLDGQLDVTCFIFMTMRPWTIHFRHHPGFHHPIFKPFHHPDLSLSWRPSVKKNFLLTLSKPKANLPAANPRQSSPMLQCSKNVDCSPTLYSTTRIDDFKDVELIQDTNGGCSALKRFKIRWDPSMNLSPAKQSCAESRPSQWTLFTQTKERKKKKNQPPDAWPAGAAPSIVHSQWPQTSFTHHQSDSCSGSSAAR